MEMARIKYYICPIRKLEVTNWAISSRTADYLPRHLGFTIMTEYAEYSGHQQKRTYSLATFIAGRCTCAGWKVMPGVAS